MNETRNMDMARIASKAELYISRRSCYAQNNMCQGHAAFNVRQAQELIATLMQIEANFVASNCDMSAEIFHKQVEYLVEHCSSGAFHYQTTATAGWIICNCSPENPLDSMGVLFDQNLDMDSQLKDLYADGLEAGDEAFGELRPAFNSVWDKFYPAFIERLEAILDENDQAGRARRSER